MYRLRCAVLVLLVVVVGIGLWVAATASGQSRGPKQAVSSAPQMPAFDPSNRDSRAAFEKAAAQAAANVRAAAREKTRHEGLRWSGANFLAGVKAEDAEYQTRKSAADLLSAQDAPQARLDCFRWGLSDNKFRLVGWSGAISSVTETSEGKLVVLLVRPTLATSDGHRAVATPSTSKETWRLDNRGHAVCERVEGPPENQKVIHVY